MKKNKSNPNTEATTRENEYVDDETNKKSAGLPPGWTRHTVIMREVQIEKLKALAFWCQIPFKDALDKILVSFFESTDIPIPFLEKKAVDKLFDRAFPKDPPTTT